MRALTVVSIGVMAVLYGPAAMAGGGCYATCKAVNDACSAIVVSSNKELPRWTRVKLLPDCFDLKAEKGSLYLIFRSKGQKGEASVKEGELFRVSLAAFKTLDCLPGDQSFCAEDGYARVQQGKAFDSAAPSKITGEPCQLGLPCGKVGLSADGSLAVVVNDPALTGAMTFYPSRGKSGAVKFDMAAGSMLVPAGALKPGEIYRYRLVLVDNSTRAEGEFAVMSKQAQSDSDAALAEAMKQPAEMREQAVIQSLLLDGRDWEAFERTLEPRK